VAYSSVDVHITHHTGSKEVIQDDKLPIKLSSNLQIYHLERGTVSQRDYCLLSVINSTSFIHFHSPCDLSVWVPTGDCSYS